MEINMPVVNGEQQIKPADMQKAENSMIASHGNTQQTIDKIQTKLIGLADRNESLLSRIMMPKKDKELMLAQQEHHIAVLKEVNKAELKQTQDILESRIRATREACNSVLLTVVTALKAMSAERANHAIKTTTERMLSDMHVTLIGIDDNFKRVESYNAPQVRDASLRMAATALLTIENTYTEFLNYISTNNLLK
jgi:hypothetical protein